LVRAALFSNGLWVEGYSALIQSALRERHQAVSISHPTNGGMSSIYFVVIFLLSSLEVFFQSNHEDAIFFILIYIYPYLYRDSNLDHINGYMCGSHYIKPNKRRKK
jgi:hypothetical protein